MVNCETEVRKMNDRIAICTGAAMGNGFGISMAMAKKGAKVMLLDRSEAVFEAEKKMQSSGCYVKAFICDVTDKAQVNEVTKKIAEKFGGVDILVNNAGIARLCRFEDSTEELLDMHIKVNIKGAWNMTGACLPYMKRNRYGRIINISSVTGTMVADPGYTAYAITKAGLSGLTKALSVETAPYGITCNAICPGFILTPNVQRSAAATNPDDPQSVLDSIAANVPLGALGTPMQVGELAAFLASEAAGYITGTNIVIDGGAMIPETNAMGLR